MVAGVWMQRPAPRSEVAAGPAVLEGATGRPFAELLGRRVADPVGATRTGDASTGPAPGGAWGQYLLPTGPVEARRRDLSHLVGGGSMYSTADDLLRIVRGPGRAGSRGR